MTTRKPNPKDATMRNVRAGSKARQKLSEKLTKLGDRVKVIEQRLKQLEAKTK